MLFNSVEFAIFLPIVFLIHWFAASKSERWQNAVLLVASYTFYGWWDWRFLSLIAVSSLLDYLVGVGLAEERSARKRKFLLLLSISVNLGFLGIFKYFNFFAENLVSAFTLLGKPLEPTRLNIILPVGISFYTFQTLSYSIDVYRRKLEPTRDILAFLTFVSFFPQLVAGPIERAANLLPQFYSRRSFDYGPAVDGMRQALWGLFKKIVIADNCAKIVNDVFANHTAHSGSTLLLGATFFAFQIYGDFSGYSDIAIGTSRLFGINLMRNFAFPYFSRDIAEFWRRWHISLSSWFRDYVYIPLGGSKGTTWLKLRNVFVIFLVSGLWHGAKWTFVAWGFIHACYFVPLMLLSRNREHRNVVAEDRLFPSIKEFGQIAITFFITVIAWVFFRADSIASALEITARILSPSLFSFPTNMPTQILVLVVLLFAIEWVQRTKPHGLDLRGLAIPKPVRWTVYYGIATAILVFAGEQQVFIYFQF